MPNLVWVTKGIVNDDWIVGFDESDGPVVLFVNVEGNCPVSIWKHDYPGKVEIAIPDRIAVEKVRGEGINSLNGRVLRRYDNELLRSRWI